LNSARSENSRSDKTVRNLRWFTVDEIRGQIEDGQVNYWQVTVKIGFTLDGEDD
jgi:hypothetical protein